jgi:DNA helicase HerA-like ATPase
VLTELEVGEALVSMLEENGAPAMVQRAKIAPPRSQVGAITLDQRKQIIQSSVVYGHYEKVVDRESAFEKLRARAAGRVEAAGAPATTPGASVPEGAKDSFFNKVIGGAESVFQPTIGPRGAVHDSVATSMMKSAVRAASSQVGRQVVRGILGGLLGGGRR